jgi:hypothetical protein
MPEHPGKAAASFDLVYTLARKLPGVEVSTAYGKTALKANGKLMACPAINKSAEPDSLIVKIGFDERAELVETDPDVYYVTDHYVPYPSVLVRMSRIRPDALEGLLQMAWRFATREKSRAAKPGSKKRKPSGRGLR